MTDGTPSSSTDDKTNSRYSKNIILFHVNLYDYTEIKVHFFVENATLPWNLPSLNY